MIKKEIVCYIINLIFTIIVGAVLTSHGYGPSTWQWWVCVLCVTFNYIAGKESMYK